MCEERYVRSRVFAWKVRFSADDEMGCGEVVERGKDLRCVESRVQWDLYSPRQLPQILPVLGEQHTSIAPSLNNAYVTFTIHQHSPQSMNTSHTVANSILLPNDTATLSPFFTPSFCNPRASLFEPRSSASYVSRVRWWCDITLLTHQSRTSKSRSRSSRVTVPILSHNIRKVLWHRLLQ
jgi:hypothetical protein